MTEVVKTLKSSRIIEEITLYISILTRYIELNNGIGNTDVSKNSENFFCGLFNLVYGLKLQNLNKIQVNFPAIDLGDNEKSICYQITARSTINRKIHY